MSVYERKIIKDMISACKQAYGSGLQTGNGGNISSRLKNKNQMLVKASGYSFNDIKSDGFVLADFKGNKIRGKGKATSEALLHGFIYQTRNDINSIIHVHAPYSIAWSCISTELPLTTWQSKIKITDCVKCLAIPSPTVREQDMHMVSDLFSRYPKAKAFILERHGIVAMGNTPKEAQYLAEFIEETAHIALLEEIARKLDLGT